LIELARLIDDGAIRPIVEAILPLAQARAAYERGARDHPRGKLILDAAGDSARGLRSDAQEPS
jgi:NADPH:quinone reductase-like Zn-dependent oxidoreductase